MQKFLTKLSKINFTSYSDGKLVSDSGWAVSYHVKLQDTHGLTESVFQVCVRVTYQDAYVTSYGCVSVEESNLFGNWFMHTRCAVDRAEYNKSSALEKVGKSLFESL